MVQRAVASYRVAETLGNRGMLKTPVAATARTTFGPPGALSSYRQAPTGLRISPSGHRP